MELVTKNKHIKPVEVVRDKDGFFIHPGLIFWDENTPSSVIEHWFKDNEIRMGWVMFDDDAAPNLVDEWFDGDLSDCTTWQPSLPKNAFILTIHDTEDGPCCVYAIPESDH